MRSNIAPSTAHLPLVSPSPPLARSCFRRPYDHLNAAPRLEKKVVWRLELGVAQLAAPTKPSARRVISAIYLLFFARPFACGSLLRREGAVPPARAAEENFEPALEAILREPRLSRRSLISIRDPQECHHVSTVFERS